jgi:hypothetical protein
MTPTENIQETTNKTVKQLENKISNITKTIEKKNNEQLQLIEYNKNKNGLHIPIGLVFSIGLSFVLIRAYNCPVEMSLLTSLATGITIGTGVKKYFENKRKKIEKENPNINFKESNIDENYEEIKRLNIEKIYLTNEKAILIKNNMEKIKETVELHHEFEKEKMNDSIELHHPLDEMQNGYESNKPKVKTKTKKI